MSLRKLGFALEAETDTPLQKLVLIGLAEGVLIPSLVEFCRASRDEVWNAIEWLENNGFLPLEEENYTPPNPPVPAAVRHRLIAEAGACVACGSTERLVVDHVVPVRRGGTNDISNLQVLCARCNTSKGSKLMSEWKGRPCS